MLSIVKPDPLDDRIVDFVIGTFEDVIVLDIISSCLEEIRHDDNGDKYELLIAGEDSPDCSNGELSGEGLLGDLVEEGLFIGRVTAGNPTEHGGGGGRIGKLTNCAARAAAAIIGCGGIMWFCVGIFKLIGKLLVCWLVGESSPLLHEPTEGCELDPDISIGCGSNPGCK